MLACDSLNITQYAPNKASGLLNTRTSAVFGTNTDVYHHKVREYLIDQTPLSNNIISVFCAVSHFARLKHGLCIASQMQIAKRAKLSRQSTNVHLQVLEKTAIKGRPLIRKTVRNSGPLRSTNAYEILDLNTLQYQKCSQWLLGKGPKLRPISKRVKCALTETKTPPNTVFTAVKLCDTNKNRASKYIYKKRTYKTRARESVPFLDKSKRNNMEPKSAEPNIKDLSALSNLPIIKEKPEDRILRQMMCKVDGYIPDWTAAEAFEPLLQKGLQDSALAPLAKLAIRLRKTKQQLKQNIQAVCEARSVDELFRFALCAIRDDYKPHIMVQPSQKVRMPVTEDEVYKAVRALDHHFINGEALFAGECDGKPGIWLYKGDQSAYHMKSFYDPEKSYFSRSIGNVIARMHEHAKNHIIRDCYHQIVKLPPCPDWAASTDRLVGFDLDRKLVPADRKIEVRLPTRREDAMYLDKTQQVQQGDFEVEPSARGEKYMFCPIELCWIPKVGASDHWDGPGDERRRYSEGVNDLS